MSKALMDVLSGTNPQRRPVWFMRQAGRYLPEYRAVREKAGSFLELCYNPELACEVTLQPLRRFDLDGAIVFADILVVPHAMGLGVRFEEGEGPVLETVRDLAAVARLRAVDESIECASIYETVKRVHASLPENVTLIGFCGAPWTVASYMIEGRSSDRVLARAAASGGEDWFQQLIDRLVAESVTYLSGQIRAGAEAVQIFDSWAGELTGSLTLRYVIEPLTRMVKALKSLHPEVPVIVFGRGLGVRHIDLAASCGCEAVGIEAELPMGWAAGNLSRKVVVQGNLDPLALMAPETMMCREVEMVAGAIDKSRHIFNLGHGIRPGTDPARIAKVIDTIRRWDA